MDSVRSSGRTVELVSGSQASSVTEVLRVNGTRGQPMMVSGKNSEGSRSIDTAANTGQYL